MPPMAVKDASLGPHGGPSLVPAAAAPAVRGPGVSAAEAGPDTAPALAVPAAPAPAIPGTGVQGATAR